jgi:hypothetical protein
VIRAGPKWVEAQREFVRCANPSLVLMFARAMVATISTTPRSAMVDVAGPERSFMADFLRGTVAPDVLPSVVGDPSARYFGVDVGSDALVPLRATIAGTIDYATWTAALGKA